MHQQVVLDLRLPVFDIGLSFAKYLHYILRRDFVVYLTHACVLIVLYAFSLVFG